MIEFDTPIGTTETPIERLSPLVTDEVVNQANQLLMEHLEQTILKDNGGDPPPPEDPTKPTDEKPEPENNDRWVLAYMVGGFLGAFCVALVTRDSQFANTAKLPEFALFMEGVFALLRYGYDHKESDS